MSKKIILFFLLLVLIPSVVSGESLDQKIGKIIHKNRQYMEIGVAYHHIESGKKGSVNGDTEYPLASVFKIGILLPLLQEIEGGKLTLKSTIYMNESDKCIGAGNLQNKKSGTGYSVDKLIQLMMQVSDNTATDLLWKQVGTWRIKKFCGDPKFKNCNIYSPNRPLYLLSLGCGSEFKGKSPTEIAQIWERKTPKERMLSLDRIKKEFSNLTISQFQKLEDDSEQLPFEASYAIAKASDNSSSPEAITEMLVELQKYEIVNRELSEYALNVMKGCKYNTRIPAGLPKGTVVAHKTGTICGIINDAGIIYLPDGTHLATAIFVKSVKKGAAPKAELAIKQISAAIYTQFTKDIAN